MQVWAIRQWVGSLTGERIPSQIPFFLFFFLKKLSPFHLYSAFLGVFGSSVVAPPLILAQQKKRAIRAIKVAAACFLAVQWLLRLLSARQCGCWRGEKSRARSSGERWNGHSSLQCLQEKTAGTLVHRPVGLENNGPAISQHEVLWNCPCHSTIGCSLACSHAVSELRGPRETDLQMRKCFLKNQGFQNQHTEFAAFSISYSLIQNVIWFMNYKWLRFLHKD